MRKEKVGHLKKQKPILGLSQRRGLWHFSRSSSLEHEQASAGERIPQELYGPAFAQNRWRDSLWKTF